MFLYLILISRRGSEIGNIFMALNTKPYEDGEKRATKSVLAGANITS